MACPTRFAPTTACPSPRLEFTGSRNSTCGGCAWVFSINGSSRRSRGGRRRHLVHSLLQRPLGPRRRTGLHHQGVATCYPCSRFILLPIFPVAQSQVRVLPGEPTGLSPYKRVTRTFSRPSVI